MGRNLKFDSRVLELNSRFLPKASLPLCLGYSLPKKEKKFLTTALSIVDNRSSIIFHHKNCPLMNKGRNDFAERPRACTLRVVRFPSPSRILLCRVNVTRVCELLVLLCARGPCRA